MLDPILTRIRLGQWQRWEVFVELRGGNSATVQRIGYVYASSQKQAVKLARQAVKQTGASLGKRARLSRLHTNSLASWEYEVWLHSAVREQGTPHVGPVVDGQGCALACFIPKG